MIILKNTYQDEFAGAHVCFFCPRYTVITIIIITDRSGLLFLGSSGDFQRRLLRNHRKLGVLLTLNPPYGVQVFFVFWYLSASWIFVRDVGTGLALQFRPRSEKPVILVIIFCTHRCT